MPRRTHVGVCLYVSEDVYTEHACIHDCVHVISGCGIFLSLCTHAWGYSLACLRKRLSEKELLCPSL